MKKILAQIISSLAVLFLAACSQQQTEILSYCGKSFVTEKMEINGVDIVNKLMQLSIAKDKNNCFNFEQLKNIGVVKKTDRNSTFITLYEKEVLSDAEKQLPIGEQLDKIYKSNIYTMIVEFEIKEDSSVIQMDGNGGTGTLLGKIQ